MLHLLSDCVETTSQCSARSRRIVAAKKVGAKVCRAANAG